MKITAFLFSLLSVTLFLASPISAQDRDYLTDQEIEVVRDNQQIDDRVKTLVHAIDRRLAVLGLQAPPKEKASDWGPMPSGTRIELLRDVKNLLQKCVDDIDNLADRPDSMVMDPEKDKKRVKGFSDLFPKAVHELADGAARFEPLLKSEFEKAVDERERGLIATSIDLCDQIQASVAKLPALLEKKKH